MRACVCLFYSVFTVTQDFASDLLSLNAIIILTIDGLFF